MKINKIVIFLNKLIKILELYKDIGSLNDMLDAIYEDIIKSKKNTDNKFGSKDASLPEQDLDSLIKSFEGKSKDDIEACLRPLSKHDLQAIASKLGLKILTSSTKNDIVNIILEHYGYKLLQ